MSSHRANRQTIRSGSFFKETLTPLVSINSVEALMGSTVTSVFAAGLALSLAGSPEDEPQPTRSEPAAAAVSQLRTNLDGERSIDALASFQVPGTH